MQLNYSTWASLSLSSGKHVDYRLQVTGNGTLISFSTELDRKQRREAVNKLLENEKIEMQQCKDENGNMEWRARTGTIPFETAFSPLHEGEDSDDKPIVLMDMSYPGGASPSRACGFDDGGYASHMSPR